MLHNQFTCQVFIEAVTFSNIELLGEGTHTRTGPFGITRSVTVGEGQAGAYMIMELYDNVFPIFQVWDVSGDVYTAVDADNDG